MLETMNKLWAWREKQQLNPGRGWWMWRRLTLQLLQHRHLHLQHLFGLLGRLHLQRHVLPRQQVQGLVDLPEPAPADLLQLGRGTERSQYSQRATSDVREQLVTFLSLLQCFSLSSCFFSFLTPLNNLLTVLTLSSFLRLDVWLPSSFHLFTFSLVLFCLSLSASRRIDTLDAVNWTVKCKQPAGSTLRSDWLRQQLHYVTSYFTAVFLFMNSVLV